MDFLIEMLHAIAEIRNPIFDAFFSLITRLGEEIFFLAVAIFFFWCVNKRQGYFILITGLFGTVVNQGAKLLFRIPRPWVYDPTIEVVGNAKEAATGYSFPSGHTQNATGTLGAIAAYKPTWKRVVLCVTLILLVGFSRMYLGVHTLLDVGVSLILATALILILRPVFVDDEKYDKFMPLVVALGVVLSVALLIFVLSIGGDETLDPHNYESGLKNACTLMGCTIGLIPTYIVDRKFTKFETHAKWYAQIIKVVIGLGIVLAIKSGLSAPLTALCAGNAYLGRIIRYFLIVIFAGVLWPMTFKWFGALRIAKLDALTEKLTKKREKKA
jgi:undecaprenyl-diphosphatase